MNYTLIKRLKHLVEYAVVMLFRSFLLVVPLRVVYLFTTILGWFTFYVVRFRRDITMDNLRNAFGDEYGERELRTIARTAYIHIGMTFIEMILAPKIYSRIREMVDVQEFDIVWRLYNENRGIVTVAAHFGSWELCGAVISAHGVKVTAVAKRQSNPYIDRLVTRNREYMGIKITTRGAPLKQILQALRRHEMVGLISDQGDRKNGMFVDFFGRRALAPRGAAQLALKYRVPLVVIAMVRLKNGRYKTFAEEVAYSSDDTVESLTQRYTKIMEDIIRKYPHQYFWMHRRWKHSENAR